jgi:hypothetical protein
MEAKEIIKVVDEKTSFQHGGGSVMGLFAHVYKIFHLILCEAQKSTKIAEKEEKNKRERAPLAK